MSALSSLLCCNLKSFEIRKELWLPGIHAIKCLPGRLEGKAPQKRRRSATEAVMQRHLPPPHTHTHIQQRAALLLEQLTATSSGTTLPPLPPVSVRRELFPSTPVRKGSSPSASAPPRLKRREAVGSVVLNAQSSSSSSNVLQSSSSSSSAYKTPQKQEAKKRVPVTPVDATPKRFRSRSADPTTWESRCIRFARMHGSEYRNKDGALSQRRRARSHQLQYKSASSRV